jgi:RNA recognition motif-containing protein
MTKGRPIASETGEGHPNTTVFIKGIPERASNKICTQCALISIKHPVRNVNNFISFALGILFFTSSLYDLESFFSEIGPIRQCFVVSSNEDKSLNRGIGFVHLYVS